MNLRKRGERGFFMLLVLMVIIALSGLAVVSGSMMRPARLALDVHAEDAAAQALADSALEEALLKLSARSEPTFSHAASGDDANTGWMEVTKSQSNSYKALALTVRGKVCSAGILSDDDRRYWCVMELAVIVTADEVGRWRVRDYLSRGGRREQRE
jgi:Tfp pilus assembly protein PilX